MTAADPLLDHPAFAPVTEYGCAACNRHHAHGLDPLFAAHLHRAARHHEPARRKPRPAEVLRRAVEELDCSVPSLPSWGLA